MGARLVYESESVLVVDDFVPNSEFEALRAMFRTQEFRRVGDGVELNSTLRLGDPITYSSAKNYYIRIRPKEKNDRDVKAETVRDTLERSIVCYPTGSPIDFYFERIQLLRDIRLPEFSGFHAADIQEISARCSMTSRGSNSSCNADHSQSCSHFFYVHRAWNCDWGGELVIDEPECCDKHVGIVGANDNPSLVPFGFATAVMPKPNRLVIVAPNRPHKIASVDPNAGDSLRMSYHGYLSGT
jgi:hypothetical protein